MHMTASSHAVRRLLALSIAARLPEAMLGIGLIVHTQRLTGSFALAGLAAAAYGLAAGASGPPLGHLIDRRGATLVLASSASLQALLLGAIALAPAHAPAAAPVLLAAGIGLATPPVGACLRTQLPSLLADSGTVGRAYALETSLIELTWVAGPPLVLGLGACWSTGGALAVVGLIMLASTLAFTLQPLSRDWKPATGLARKRGGSLRTPAMRTLTLALFALGILLGADEVAVTAAAKALSGNTAAAAPLLALWAAGSFVGGLLASRFSDRLGRAGGVVIGLFAIAAGHLVLIPAAFSGTCLLAAALVCAGSTIAPTESAVYALVDAAAPAGTVTEAFSWLGTAMAVGSAAGASVAGLLAQQFGAPAAFALGAGVCAVAAPVVAARSRTRAPTSQRHDPALLSA